MQQEHCQEKAYTYNKEKAHTCNIQYQECPPDMQLRIRIGEHMVYVTLVQELQCTHISASYNYLYTMLTALSVLFIGFSTTPLYCPCFKACRTCGERIMNVSKYMYCGASY